MHALRNHLELMNALLFLLSETCPFLHESIDG